ncbi:MAG: transposase [Gammaproteobacteria bacterium]|nr:transposase [Gammaproteobacteria bacterium]
MVRILREADAGSVPKVAKRHGVSEQTIYAWRKRYGTLDVADVRRLREPLVQLFFLVRRIRSGKL